MGAVGYLPPSTEQTIQLAEASPVSEQTDYPSQPPSSTHQAAEQTNRLVEASSVSEKTDCPLQPPMSNY